MRIAFLALLGSVLFGATAGAQTSTWMPPAAAEKYLDAVEGLSLPQAIEKALEQEPSLRAARAEVAVAEGLKVQAGVRPNPMVSFWQQQEPGGVDSQTRVEVVWPLDLFRRTGRVAVADRQIDAARHGAADRERVLAAETRARYGDLASAIRQLVILNDVIDATSSQHGLVVARVEQGATPPLERDLLRVELYRLEADRLRQSSVVEEAMIALKRALGLGPDEPLKIRDDLEHLVATETGPALPSRGETLPVRPDIRAAHARVQVAEAEIERARRDGRPEVNLFGMYMRMDAGFSQRAFGTGGRLEPIRGLFHYVAAGAAVTIPLRDRKQGDLAAAEARRAGAAADREATELTAQTEVAAARVRDERARQAVAVYSSEALASGRRNLAVVTQTYELGRATVFDVLMEQRRYLDLEGAFTSALKEAYDARQALRQALGEAL